MPVGAAGTRPAPRAPGTLPSHYAPAATVLLAAPAEVPAAGTPSGPGEPPRTGLLAAADVPTPPGVVRLAAPPDDAAYARALYRALREADALGLHRVVVVPPADGSALATAITDRLRRAAAGSQEPTR